MRSKWLALLMLLMLVSAAAFAALRLPWRRLSTPPVAGAVAGPVDIGFAQFMIVHHDQAVTMSQILMADGDSAVRGLAISMQTAQLLEMGQLRGLLSAWNKPLLPSSRRMDWLLQGRLAPDAALLRYIADCNAASGGMPGLATSDELNQLRERDGRDRDRLFIRLMIRHHAGGLPMAQFAAANAATPQIAGIAAYDLAEQTQELDSLSLILDRDFAP